MTNATTAPSAPAPVVGATTAEIISAYRVLLRRDPDEAGLRYWQHRSDAGMDLLELVLAFVKSAEYRAANSLAPSTRDIPRLPPLGSRVLVVRGDLNSSTGYCRAIQLYVEAMAHRFDAIFGVDLHGHASRFLPRWKHELVVDADLASLLQGCAPGSMVLNITTPDHFLRFDGALNVGLFFWESDRLQLPEWSMRLLFMDEIWAPTQQLLRALEESRYGLHVRYAPCPLPSDLPAYVPDDALAGMLFREVGWDPHASASIRSLGRLRQQSSFVLATVNTLLPRKGYPVLAYEWLSWLKAQPRDDAALLIKTGSIDIHKRPADVHREIADIFGSIAATLGVQRTGVFVSTQNVSDDSVQTLLATSDAYVTCSFGEGFGLGVFEALALGKPVICGRHSGFEELLPSNYPYFLATDTSNYGVPDPVGLFSISSRWSVPIPGSLAKALARIAEDAKSGELQAHVRAALDQATQMSRSRFAGVLDPR